MQTDFIELRSDTFTKPTPEMKAAMLAAPVGDDVFGEDPTINLLQEKAAELFGAEAALFCASGTMTNQIALNVHSRPGDEAICHQFAHIYNYEGGGMMFNSGLSAKLIGDESGLQTAAQVEAAINNPDDVHAARTSIVAVENTSNKGGGVCYNFSALREMGEVARQNNLAYHLDGARLFNALVKNNENPKDYGQLFDSISICLSKGLGCPVGSLLLGSRDFIREAKFVRKRFGGGWRQAGILAAAGIYALDNHINRLTEDHAKANKLAACLRQQDYVEKVMPVETNIVIFKLKDESKSSTFIKNMADENIHLVGMGPGRLRMVTHLDVSDQQINRVCEVLTEYHSR